MYVGTFGVLAIFFDNVGHLVAFVFFLWSFSQSIEVLGSLCTLNILVLSFLNLCIPLWSFCLDLARV